MKFSTLLTIASSAYALSTSSIQATLTSTTQIDVPSSCSFEDGYTATAQSDLDSLSSCDAIDGDVYITGSIGTGAIANVRAIYGDLIISNATGLSSFSADSLSTITGELRLTSLTILDTLSLGSLQSVGAINWVTLPTLVSTGLKQVTECNAIVISDTQLTSIEGINPTTVETFNINNNLQLSSIESELETVTNALSVAYNGESTDVSFDKLSFAYNITFYSVSSVSMANLTTVNKSIGFFESNVEELSFTELESIGGDLTITNNDELTDLDFSKLTSIGGGYVVSNNTKLDSTGNFDELKSVVGAVIIKGDLDNVTLPSLKTVRGAFTLTSEGSADCSPFDDLHDQGSIQGEYSCSAASPSSSSESGSSTKSSSSSSSKSSGSSDESSTASGSASSSSAGAGAASYVIQYTSIFGALGAVLFALF